MKIPDAKKPVLDPRDLQQLTSSTRVIVSFGASDGGFELALQLRLDIMDRYGKRTLKRAANGKTCAEADETFCYLDAITLQAEPNTKTPRLRIKKQVDGGMNGETIEQEVGIDVFKMQNDFWDIYYPRAMANSAVMIFLVSTPWLTSKYCMQELGWFLVQALKDANRAQHIRCIFMVFSEAKAGFETLLLNLVRGVVAQRKRPGSCLAGLNDDLYRLLHQALSQVDLLPYVSSLFAKVLARVRQRTIDVPPALVNREKFEKEEPFREIEKAGFTDYYGIDEERIPLEPSAARPPHARYAHDFSFKYGVERHELAPLFARLDHDLAKGCGIVPRRA